ncbi:MAG: tripartite tricarboxylate transporter substrate binding protein, partial [Betaproteobacteria bacterium]|nr:tripartite tricarboxylate transporter substrate binding protein [Betaproteobacteria bacterium]
TVILNGAVRKALEMPDVRQSLLTVGSDIASDLSPTEFAKFLKRDVDHWSAVIKTIGVVPQ